ncbi:MAG: Ycf51 family protein [Microcystaceae cyanobacterium]
MFDNLLSSDLATYTKWSGILTLLFLVLTILAFFVQWGIRFRLVGVTSFMAVLTIGFFGLGLGFFERVTIPDAVRYALVYDNGANKAVITVPQDINSTQLEATLKQAAYDLFSYGRTDLGGDHLMTIRARTLRHPQSGVTNPVYLGQVKRSLAIREDEDLQIELFN